MTFNPPSDDDGPSGYGKPPKANQFKPGQSGNPKGRPKKKPAATLYEAIAEGLKETVTVKVNGRSRKMTQADLIAKQLLSKASSTDMKAMHILTQMTKGAPAPSPLPGLIGAADRLRNKFKLIQERRKGRGFEGQVGQSGRGALPASDKNVEFEKPQHGSGGSDQGEVSVTQKDAIGGSPAPENPSESNDVGDTSAASESPQRRPPGEHLENKE